MRRCHWIQAKKRSTSHLLAYRLNRRPSCVAALLRFERCGAIISMPSRRSCIQWIAVVSAIADEVLWLGLDHVETELTKRTSWWLAACVLTESGSWRSTIAAIFRPFPRFVAPIAVPPPLA